MSDRHDNEDEDDLFRRAMADVQPLQHDRVESRRKPPVFRKRVQNEQKDIVDTLSDDFIPPCDEYLEFARPGVQKSLLKQMRTGKCRVDDHIDMHGHTRDQARLRLLGFIHQAQQQGDKIVCVVHGKGYHSEDGHPVLKAMVNKWLQNIPEVLAFTTAPLKDGGTGAVYVLLKRLQPNDH